MAKCRWAPPTSVWEPWPAIPATVGSPSLGTEEECARLVAYGQEVPPFVEVYVVPYRQHHTIHSFTCILSPWQNYSLSLATKLLFWSPALTAESLHKPLCCVCQPHLCQHTLAPAHNPVDPMPASLYCNPLSPFTIMLYDHMVEILTISSLCYVFLRGYKSICSSS